jgi:PST family polysaccharide transporter
MLQSIITTVGLIYSAKGRSDWQFRWGAACSALFVASFVIGLPWGIMGVAISYSAMNAVVTIPCLAIAFRLIELSLSEFLSRLWPILKAALLMSVLVFLWLTGLQRFSVTNPWVQLISSAALGVLIYVPLVVWWKIPALYELRSILEQSGNSIAVKAARYLPQPAADFTSSRSAP